MLKKQMSKLKFLELIIAGSAGLMVLVAGSFAAYHIYLDDPVGGIIVLGVSLVVALLVGSEVRHEVKNIIMNTESEDDQL